MNKNMVTLENMHEYIDANQIAAMQQYCFNNKITFDINFLRRTTLNWEREGLIRELILDKGLPTQAVIMSNDFRKVGFSQTLEFMQPLFDQQAKHLQQIDEWKESITIDFLTEPPPTE